MSKITKIISALALSTMMVTSLVGCSGGNSEGASSGDTITVNFWTALKKFNMIFGQVKQKNLMLLIPR